MTRMMEIFSVSGAVLLPLLLLLAAVVGGQARAVAVCVSAQVSLLLLACLVPVLAFFLLARQAPAPRVREVWLGLLGYCGVNTAKEERRVAAVVRSGSLEVSKEGNNRRQA